MEVLFAHMPKVRCYRGKLPVIFQFREYEFGFDPELEDDGGLIFIMGNMEIRTLDTFQRRVEGKQTT